MLITSLRIMYLKSRTYLAPETEEFILCQESAVMSVPDRADNGYEDNDLGEI